MKNRLLLFSIGCCIFGRGIVFRPATAQVTPDGTTSTTVNANGNNFTIQNGNRARSNLFHSFRDFSLPNGGSAYFDNAADIVNIFSRVTGGNISNIDGLIRANNANLFLINPAGIIFGAGARLDIGGSFYGSTADSILFEDGELSATDFDNPPLITINAPIGLNLRDNPAPIIIRNSSLTVSPRQNFNLIGGDIELNTGTIEVTEGSIELISLFQAGTIVIDEDNNFNIPENLERANINLDNFRVRVVANSTNSGEINLTGRTLSLSNEADLINATGTIGNAGNVNLDATDSILINNNSRIFTNTFAQGDAGNVYIKANNTLTLSGINTGIFSSAELTPSVDSSLEGSAGNINIEANNISITDGALINSSTFGSGDAGKITLKAGGIELRGDNSSIFSAVGSLESNAEATGNGGAIELETQTLSLSDGATIVTQTFGAGSAGTIEINAAEAINISGVASFPFLENGERGGFSSGLFSNTENDATGSGGEIRVTTSRLQIDDGGVINARSRSNAPAGSVFVNADVLEITDGGQILATAFDNGAAGNINLNISQRILISGIDPNFATRLNSLTKSFGEQEAEFSIDPVSADSGVFASTTASPVEGTTGEIAIRVGERLELRDGSLISARASGNADGGNISINAADGFVVAFPSTDLGGDIVADAPQGKGGNITIKARGVLGLAENAAFDDAGNRASNGSNDLDATGAVDGIVEIITPDVDAFQGAAELPTNPVEPERNVAQACRSNLASGQVSGLTVKGKGGIPPLPTAPLSSDAILVDGRISPTNPQIQSLEIKPIKTSIGDIYPARGIIKTEDGQIILTAYPTDSAAQRTIKGSANCSSS